MSSRLLFALVLAPLALPGCDADCDNPARIDGQWAITANTTTEDWSITGFSADQSLEQTTLLHGIFPNGASSWTLKHVPADGNFRVTIDGQQYEATYKPSADNCNNFDLAFEGNWVNPETGATHRFAFAGDLLWYGDELGGTWTYEDQWFDEELDLSGTIEIPKGEMHGSLGASVDSGQ